MQQMNCNDLPWRISLSGSNLGEDTGSVLSDEQQPSANNGVTAGRFG